ncbi:hypothetical protein KSP40_PGU000728 [Platanthera guangdongensis]|uniref:EF hand associated type-2 domain-containing protein n=1 Tax=Platanthera guangdongensis TaxID=2320717 RepID=A0ABR2MI70_9ASPA
MDNHLMVNPVSGRLIIHGPQSPLHSDFSPLATHFRRNCPLEYLLCRRIAASSSPTNFVGRSGVRIVVVGDVGTRKSSLIIAAATESFPENVPSILPPTRPPCGLLSRSSTPHHHRYIIQVKCFNAPLQHPEIAGVQKLVQEKMPEGVNEQGLTLTGFLFLHALFIEKGRLETTWTVLRKFGYDNDIKLRDDLLPRIFKRAPDQVKTCEWRHSQLVVTRMVSLRRWALAQD